MAPAPAPWRARLLRFWLDTLPPLDGPLRLVVVGGLLVIALAHPTSPLRAVDTVAHIPSALWTPSPIIALDLSLDTLRALRAVVLVAWICAALGLLQALSAPILGLGVVVLHGATAGYLGLNHTWYLPVWTLAWLAFARTDDRWTLDTHLRRLLGRPPPDADGLAFTGFARMGVTVVAVYLLFAAAIAKLVDAGPAWMDGVTLQRYIFQQRYAAVWPGLANLLVEHRILCAALSIFTMLIELAAPLALISRRARHALALLAFGFHLGIKAVMLPNFAAHAWCYLLLLDRRWLLDRLHRRPETPRPTRRPRLALPAALAGTAFALAISAQMIVRVEGWPLSYVPMYSGYRDADHYGDTPLAELRTPAGARRAVDRLAADYNWTLARGVSWRAQLHLTADDRPARRVRMRDFGAYNGLWSDLGYRLVTPLLRGEPAPDTRRRLDALAHDAARRLPDAADYDGLALVYDFGGAFTPLMTAPLPPPMQ